MDRHASLPTLKLVLSLAASLAGGCGGRAHYTPPTFDGGSADANDAGSDTKDVVFVGTVRGVPNGYVFVGEWIFDPSAQRFRRPIGCRTSSSDPGGKYGVNRKLVVPEFWLQEAPVTNGLYRVLFRHRRLHCA